MGIVDIILPNFNKENYLKETIDSILNQSFKDFNLYIIDDNSTDNSKKVIDKYSDTRIKVLKLKRNKGVHFCRYLGIRLSKSKYISFIDADDYWDENKLKNQINFMIKNNYPFTFTDYIPVLQTTNFKKTLKRTNIVDTFTLQSFIKNSSINTSTMILERKHLRKLKFRKLDLLEDYIFKCELMKKTKIKFEKLADASAIYRIIEKSRSSQKIYNIYNLWKLNKTYNKLNFLQNLKSLLFISLNSIKKYGLK